MYYQTVFFVVTNRQVKVKGIKGLKKVQVTFIVIRKKWFLLHFKKYDRLKLEGNPALSKI